MKFMSFGIALVFLLSAVLPGFAQTGEPVPPRGDDGDDLVAQLKLTEEQIARLGKISGVVQNQAEMDRESFKGNALGLIQAARRRREMTDSHIETMLGTEQKELFEEFKRARGRNEELFMLKEGLLLTPEQVVQVEQILDDFRKEMDAGRGKGRGPGDDMNGGMPGGGHGGPGEMGGEMNGGMRGGGPGGMRGGGPGGMHGEKDSKMMDAMKQQDDKKAKQIKTLLTKEQKEMYKDIRKLQKTEMKQRMEQMHERRRPEMNREP